MMKKIQTFQQWWDALKSIAQEEALPINENDPEAYRTYYDSDYDPHAAIWEDLSNAY